MLSGLADNAGGDDRAGNIGGAAHDRLGSENSREPLGSVDAILQRDDGGVGPDDWPDHLAGAFDIPEFDCEQHIIDVADAGDLVGSLGRPDLDFAAVAFDAQAVFAHRRDMRATGDKDDIRPRLGERGAVNRADAAGADNCDPHA